MAAEIAALFNKLTVEIGFDSVFGKLSIVFTDLAVYLYKKGNS